MTQSPLPPLKIQICNLRDERPVYPWDFVVDRRTPLGNPQPITPNYSRDRVCDIYEANFRQLLADNVKASMAICELLTALLRFDELRLFCWCAPQRCHAETIARYLKEKTCSHPPKSP